MQPERRLRGRSVGYELEGDPPTTQAGQCVPQPQYTVDGIDLIGVADPDRAQADIRDQRLDVRLRVAGGSRVEQVCLSSTEHWVGVDIPAQAVESAIEMRFWNHGAQLLPAVERGRAKVVGGVDHDLAVEILGPLADKFDDVASRKRKQYRVGPSERIGDRSGSGLF